MDEYEFDTNDFKLLADAFACNFVDPDQEFDQNDIKLIIIKLNSRL